MYLGRAAFLNDLIEKCRLTGTAARRQRLHRDRYAYSFCLIVAPKQTYGKRGQDGERIYMATREGFGP
jgi:hypothetical protein